MANFLELWPGAYEVYGVAFLFHLSTDLIELVDILSGEGGAVTSGGIFKRSDFSKLGEVSSPAATIWMAQACAPEVECRGEDRVPSSASTGAGDWVFLAHHCLSRTELVLNTHVWMNDILNKF